MISQQFNVDYSIAAVFLLLFMLFHFVRSNRVEDSRLLFFPVILAYAIVLGLVDIASAVMLGDPRVPVEVCFGFCTAYLVLEVLVAALLTFCLPLLIYDVSQQERLSLFLLIIPAAVLSFVVVFENPSTGIIFSIDVQRHYADGPAEYILQLSNVLYIVLNLGIAFINRKHIEPYKMASLGAIVGIAFIAIVAQIIFRDIRCAAIALAFMFLEIYVSLMMPEKHFDSLTGIYGRPAFYEATHRLLQRRPGFQFVLVCLNVKEFKAVNTLYGSAEGDRILIEIARRLREYVGDDGTCARLHDDRFAFCIPIDRFDLDRLLHMTSDENLRRVLGSEIHLMFGIYIIDDPSIAVAIACDCARLAMEAVADSRVRRYAFYDRTQGAGFLARYEIAVDMEKSLTNGDFEVYLQPIVDLRTSRIASAEALIRWNHPEKGFLPPSEFVPAFEANGLIAELDRYVLEAVCRFQDRRCREGGQVVPVSVNLSRADLSPGFGALLVEAVDRFDLSPDSLRFEVTESAYAEDQESFEELVSCLHGRGFRLLLDDFGTGYSSLSLLEGSSFDFIKIDREFLTSIMTNDRARIVARAIIDLAASLGIPVIVEGIESFEQASLLREMGAEYGQGYHFSKPMPMSDFARTLDAFAARASG